MKDINILDSSNDKTDSILELPEFDNTSESEKKS